MDRYGLFEEETFEDLEMDGLQAWEYEDYEDFEDGEFEDYEADLFLGKLLKKAGRKLGHVARSPFTSQLLKRAAHLGAGALGTAIGGPAGGALANRIATQVIREAEYEAEFEDTFESEAEFEAEFEVMGGNLNVLNEMEYYAELAAEADGEAEADRFLGAIAGLAGSVLPKLLPLAKQAAPVIGHGIRAAGKLFRSNRRTRPLIRTLPKVAARTAVSLARQSQRGRRVNRKQVAGTMAHHLARTVANRRRLAMAMHRNRTCAQQARMKRRGRRRYGMQQRMPRSMMGIR